jgi:hypothetical protein
VEQGLGSVYTVQQRSTRQVENGGLASDPGNLNCVFVLFCYKILLFVDKFICECAQLKEFLNFTVLLN